MILFDITPSALCLLLLLDFFFTRHIRAEVAGVC